MCIRRAAARCSRSVPRSPPSRPGVVARAATPCRTGPRTRRSASRRSIWWPCAPAGRACMARLPAPRPAWRRALRIPACHSPLFASVVNLGTRMPLPGEKMQTAARPTVLAGAREGVCNSSISRNHVSPHSGVERLPLKMPSRGQKRPAAAAADGGARPAATPLRVGSSSRTNAGVPAPPAPRRRPRRAAHDPRPNVALALRGVTR